MADYEEYESKDQLAEIWHKEPPANEDPCSTCGMRDSVLIRYYNGGGKCKWCEELEALKVHLRYNGLRRFEKQRSIRFPDKIANLMPHVSLALCSILVIIGVFTGSSGLGTLGAYFGIVGSAIYYLKENF